MKKLLIDSQAFDIQKFGGISRYYTEIFVKILEKNNVEVTSSICYTNNAYVSDTELINKNYYLKSMFLVLMGKMGISIRKKIKKINNQIAIQKLKKQQYDLFIPTYYDPYFLEYIGNKPFVLTVYDMIHELFPKSFSDAKVSIDNKLILIEKATKIIAISESTKKDILKLYPKIDAQKIEVIYLSHSINSQENISIQLPKKYILFVGNRDGYKNFEFFIKSVHSLLNNDKDLFIVCAGGNNFKSKEKALISELNIENQIIQQNFDDNELASYYKNALCFVFPSEYEGFGIPVLESMACGCPVILAHHSSFPEVAGDAGVYFELNNQVNLKSKVIEILENPIIRASFVEKGFIQVKKFSWQKTANECYNVYQKTILNG